ncbi:MAG: DUF1697 domain-containing protein [Bryobacterales bacterium]|nr:DUF1697 domain-containing protein [Bryobacterales bacterium]
MQAIISLLRGVNVGGHGIIRMDALRDLYESLQLREARTYVQSGNVVFLSEKPHLDELAERIGSGIERRFGFRPAVVLRTAREMSEVVARNPFAGREGADPAKLLVTFLAGTPAAPDRERVLALNTGPEEMWMEEREIYVYFPNGFSKARLSMAVVEKGLRVAGTGRNWNSVRKLLEMARRLETGG